MKTHFSLLLAASIVLVSNTSTFTAPASSQSSENTINVANIANNRQQQNDDKCIKWLKQIPFSAIDALGQWHSYPSRTVCYLYESQRH